MNFMTPKVDVVVVGCGLFVDFMLNFIKFFYSASGHRQINWIMSSKEFEGPSDMQIWAFVTRSQWRVSDTQVTIKAHGPFCIALDFYGICSIHGKKAICVSLSCYNKGIAAQVSIVYVFPVDDNGYLIWKSSWKSAGFKIINLIRYLFPARSSCHCGYASWWCFIYSYPVTIRERIANA